MVNGNLSYSWKIINSNTSIEDWMENKDVEHDCCRWFTTEIINENCPLFDRLKCTNYKKKKK